MYNFVTVCFPKEYIWESLDKKPSEKREVKRRLELQWMVTIESCGVEKKCCVGSS